MLQNRLISKVVPYNCWGWKSGSNFVQSLLQSCDICLIQEHWLLCENLDSLIISDDFLSVGVSGMDSSIYFLLVALLVAVVFYTVNLFPQWSVGSLPTLNVYVLSQLH